MSDAQTTNSPLRVSLLGFGRVGSNVYQLLRERRAEIERRAGRLVEVAHILVFDQAELESANAERSLLTTDITQALDADAVVEVMGGQEPAKRYVLQAIASGCNIVTSNKELLTTFADEVFAAVKDAGVSFLFGATVGTATPVLEPIRDHLAVAGIDEVTGIFTGSANYLLGEMDQKLLRLENAMPSLTRLTRPELTGRDSAAKIALVSAAAFGVYPRLVDIPTEGVEEVRLADMAYAVELGYRLTLLGLARRDQEGIFAAVFPALVPVDSLLAKTGKENSMVVVRGPHFGEVAFRGPGAGGPPTACAVIADIVNLTEGFKGMTLDLGAMPRAELVAIEEQGFTFYARLHLENTKTTNLLSRLRELEVSASLKREEQLDDLQEVILITDSVPERVFRTALRDIRERGMVAEVKAVYRIVHPYS